VSRNASLSGEISALLGATLGTIQAGDSAAISFAILGGSSLQNLTETAQEAQLSYNLSVLQVQIETDNENCAGGTGAVVVSSAVPGLAQVQLLDAGGIALAPPVLLAGTYNPGILQPGSYLMEVSFSDGTYTQIPFAVLNADPVAIQSLGLSSEIVALPNATVEFSANIAGNASVTWDFGDGNQAIGNPVTHTYSSTGTYEVSCIATNATCSDTAIAFVEVGSTVGEALVINTDMRLYPNPGNGQFKLSGLPNTGAYQVLNVQGKLVHEGIVAENIDLRHLESGMYFVRYESEILPVVIVHE
jgi:hypothetical protein